VVVLLFPYPKWFAVDVKIVPLICFFLYALGRPVLQDHLLKVNHIFFGRLFLPRMFMTIWKATSILVIKQE
jgi:hypothetical protein